MLLRLALALLWLLHWLPLTALSRVGALLGSLAFTFIHDRRRVTLINLKLCFPHWTEEQRVIVAKQHFQAFMTSILAQGVGWYASLPRLRRLVQFEGKEHLDQALAQGPVILMTPHFFGVDTIGIYLSADIRTITINTRHKNATLDEVILRHRSRWNGATVFSRQDGIRAVLRAFKPGWALYYLPDQDFGPKESIFVDFFGIPTATVPALPRLARLSGARIVPCVVHQEFDRGRYRVCFYPSWEAFPGPDEREDTVRMNHFIEARVLEQPARYLWSHKRFKARPPREPSPYA